MRGASDDERTERDRDERRALIESAIGSIPDTGHEWDDDPAEWMRSQRHADERRVG